jgi:hypothetical protein
MRHFAFRRFAHLTLYATLACCASACGADSDHGPPIGSPTGPIGPIVNEGGAFSGGGSAGQPGVNANAGQPGFGPSGGAFNQPGSSGANSFGIGGTGSAGRDSFGVAGFGPGSDPFGVGGSLNASGGASFF